jgi:hypothetical protein
MRDKNETTRRDKNFVEGEHGWLSLNLLNYNKEVARK